jgi:hypothetical protein
VVTPSLLGLIIALGRHRRETTLAIHMDRRSGLTRKILEASSMVVALFIGLLILILSPVPVLIAWLIYLGSKWVAAFVTGSELDQAIMGIIAVIVVMGVALAVLMEVGRD